MGCKSCLQYADDTLLLLQPTHSFSGSLLNLNVHKSEIIIAYLGLSLSDKPSKKALYQPLIQGYKNKLSRWKSQTLNRRKININKCSHVGDVNYFHVSFHDTKRDCWRVKIRRRLLRHGHKENLRQSRPIHLINWSTVVMPKKIGRIRN
jgi:hypothetical protein